MDEATNMSRPSVLSNITETQIQELERQFREHDRQGWKNLTESYGWSDEDVEAVWNWFAVTDRVDPELRASNPRRIQ